MTAWICEQCGDGFNRRGTKHWRFCSRAHADEWMRRDIPDAAALRAWYWDDRLTANDIARKVDRDPKRVWEWLKAAGIETRPRGAASGHGFQPGQVSCVQRAHPHNGWPRQAIQSARLRTPREAYAGQRSLSPRAAPVPPTRAGKAA